MASAPPARRLQVMTDEVSEMTREPITITIPANSAANDNGRARGCALSDRQRSDAWPARPRVVGGLKSLLCDGCGEVEATRDGYCERCHDVEITAMRRRIDSRAGSAPRVEGAPDDCA